MVEKKKKKLTTDINILASQIVAEATKEPTKEPIKEKNPAAVALGRLGGLKGGKARAAQMTKEELTERGRKAAKARWSQIHQE